MRYVYRRPHDYAAQAAIVRPYPVVQWSIDLVPAALTLATPPWALGAWPTVQMTVAPLTLATPAWTITLDKHVAMAPAHLALTTPAWTVVGTIVASVPDVVGVTLSAAFKSTRDAALVPRISFANTGAVNAGLVTSQSPAAGTPATVGQVLSFVVEAGVYAWPASAVPQEIRWRLLPGTAHNISPLTGKTRTLGVGGERWMCTVTVHHATDAARNEMQAFLSRLRGRAQFARMPDTSHVRLGTLTAAQVAGAGQVGILLNLDGCSPANGTVKAREMIEVDGRLFMIAIDATAAAGAVQVEVVPPIDGAAPDDAAVSFAPRGLFRLVGNSVGWSNTPGGFSAFDAVEFVEAREF